MPLLAPTLLLGTGIQEARRAGDGGRDAGQSARIDVQQQAGKGGASGSGRRGAVAGAAGVRSTGGRAVRHPVMDQERNSRVSKKVEGLAGGGIGRHDDGRVRTEGGRGEVGVGHEGYVGSLAVAGGEMQLGRVEGSVAVRKGVRVRPGRDGQAEWGRRTYEARVLEAGDDLWGESGGNVRMGGRGGGLVCERGVVAVRHDAVRQAGLDGAERDAGRMRGAAPRCS